MDCFAWFSRINILTCTRRSWSKAGKIQKSCHTVATRYKTHFEQLCILKKKYVFQSALISAILTHFEKKNENQIFHGSLYSYCLRNLKTIFNFENESNEFICQGFLSDIARIQVVYIMTIL